MASNTQVVDRHDGKTISKVETTKSRLVNKKPTVVSEIVYVVQDAEGTKVGELKTLAEARASIGKVLKILPPTSKPKDQYKGPAKGPSGGATQGKKKGGK